MKKYLILSILALGVLSCDNDVLSSDDRASGPKIVGFENATESIAYFSDQGVVQRLLPVSLIGLGDGTLPSSDLNLQYEVDLVNSTATEGVEFDFVDGSGIVTIPAGSSFGTIALDVNTGSFSATEKTDLVLKLIPGSGVTVSESQKQIVVSFIGCQSPIVPGSYSMVSTAGFSSANVTITEVAPNVFQMPFPGVSSGGQPIPMRFTDVCGELSHLGWDFSDTYLCTASSVNYGPGNNPNVIIFTELAVYNGLTISSGLFFDRKTTTYTKN